MKNFIYALFLLVTFGCAATKKDTTTEFNQVKKSVYMYSNCLHEQVQPLLSSEEIPIDIADAVAHKCETFLIQYRKDVSDYLIASTNEGSRTQYEVLMVEPDRRVENLRDKGKRSTISRVLDYRESLNSSK